MSQYEPNESDPHPVKVKLTAGVLGELSPLGEDQLNSSIKDDPESGEWKSTVEGLSKALRDGHLLGSASPELQLDRRRREKLLRQLRKAPPRPTTNPSLPSAGSSGEDNPQVSNRRFLVFPSVREVAGVIAGIAAMAVIGLIITPLLMNLPPDRSDIAMDRMESEPEHQALFEREAETPARSLARTQSILPVSDMDGAGAADKSHVPEDRDNSRLFFDNGTIQNDEQGVLNGRGGVETENRKRVKPVPAGKASEPSEQSIALGQALDDRPSRPAGPQDEWYERGFSTRSGSREYGLPAVVSAPSAPATAPMAAPAAGAAQPANSESPFSSDFSATQSEPEAGFRFGLPSSGISDAESTPGLGDPIAGAARGVAAQSDFAYGGSGVAADHSLGEIRTETLSRSYSADAGKPLAGGFGGGSGGMEGLNKGLSPAAGPAPANSQVEELSQLQLYSTLESTVGQAELADSAGIAGLSRRQSRAPGRSTAVPAPPSAADGRWSFSADNGLPSPEAEYGNNHDILSLGKKPAPGDRGISERKASVTLDSIDAKSRSLKESLVEEETIPAVMESEPYPEIETADDPFSTFSLNTSDASFQVARAALNANRLPDPSQIRSEEFINAFDYHDPAPGDGDPVAIHFDRAIHPFEPGREVLRIGVQTAMEGWDRNSPMNLVVLIDTSGSMERPDRAEVVNSVLDVIGQTLKPTDRISVVGFARTPTLWIDGTKGGDPEEILNTVRRIRPQGGTNIEAALDLAYITSGRYFMENGDNRILLLTDGAANLGNADPEVLRTRTEAGRRSGISLDAFGIGWDGHDDRMLEELTRHSDGRYGFLNAPDEAAGYFRDKWLGALNVAARDVKVQVEFNPSRVRRYRQVGYLRHRLTRQQFLDDSVDAGEIARAEDGQALYMIEVIPDGQGPLGWARLRYRDPSSGLVQTLNRPLSFSPAVPEMELASPAMKLAFSSAAFAEKLAGNPYGAEVDLSYLNERLSEIQDSYPRNQSVVNLISMLQNARMLGF